jgi:hypothetical protein
MMTPRSKSPSAFSGITIVYVVFGTIAFMVHHLIAEGEFSSILTLSAIFQCLAFSFIVLQSHTTGGVQGISARSLMLDAFGLVCRLSSTLWLQGYLPYDESGDYLYQTFDVVSLLLVAYVLYRVFTVQHRTYDEDKDELDPMPLAAVCMVLAAIFHGNLDERPIFDTLWMCGLFVNVISVMPQLWMMTHSGRSVPALTGHFVAVMAVARIVSGSYMWHAFADIECKPWVGTFNHAGYAVLAAHAVHLLLLGDFGYYYFKNMAKNGVDAPLDLSTCWAV